ncbi:DUF2059 domain-containing protein [Bradyrhizobium sp. Gha]|uniref:DUF2059 domain-containing protein n=1 Tax=Bradyrhizobium sp. Gha TaxID=1855318 RepID=UPI0008E10389|nr:DUF2059 domain-containing protein [Bradyrhizobium sp. Gha]SFJ77664.1 hypothetical protein SAMN05216525_13562 [Bradyrhizobium sp. Gha]
MYKSLMIAIGITLLAIGVAKAETSSPAAMDAARSLAVTLKVADQYKSLLPGILLRLRPILSQDRPEIERDFDAAVPAILEANQSKYDNSMIEGAAALYAKIFSADELRDIDAFYRSPAGQKYIEKSHELSEINQKLSDEISRQATDEMKERITQSLREKGHKL